MGQHEVADALYRRVLNECEATLGAHLADTLRTVYYTYIYVVYLGLTLNPLDYPPRAWPLHDIAFTNIVWCLAHKRGGRGGGRTLRDTVCGQHTGV